MEELELLKTNNLVAVLSVYENDVFVHNLSNGQLTAGRPLKAKKLRSLFRFVNGVDEALHYSFAGLIPRNVLSFNQENGDIMFFTEPMRKSMIFNSKKGINGEYNIPRILWSYRNGALKIFALKDKVIDENTKLYNAPFFNTSKQGSVCMGNAKYKNNKDHYEDFMVFLVDQFFNSIFTHTQNDNLATQNILEAYELAKDPKFVWDKYLVRPENNFDFKTVKDLI